MNTLYSPNGQDSIDANVDQVEYLKSKGWTEKSVNKKTKKSEEK
jgi:hypothetical protein|tara:strand:- start:209 stop:340 length:132 start_codon:yes stop_codon:yes gene_type:complete